jgi:hypothetical protein
MKSKNGMRRAHIVQAIVAQYYEPERHDRCKRWIFRNIIVKQYPMSERTFWRYISMQENEYSNQLTLF